ncbi:substrate-binding periplasmic protein [Chitinimonas sp.]|uniref:substrate-binding periplasmic protein n=1 Tax=Chitinimonas sp. TaxID=1934313 RepID=UPI0035AFE400
MKPALLWLLALLYAAQLHAEVLRVGFGTNKPPYIFETEKRGLEYDIIAAAARRAGFQIEPSFAPMERQHRIMAAGKIDAIATTHEQSGLAASFSKPYIEYHNVAVALASRGLEIRSIADLGAYSVSAFQRARNLLGPQFQQMAESNPQYREEAEQIVRNRLLFSGRIDVVVGDIRIISYFNRQVATQLDTTKPLRSYDIFPPTRYRVAFRDTAWRDRFDAGLDALLASGEYAAIERQYQDYGGLLK